MNIFTYKKKSRGFTLIELLLAIGITSILLLSLVSFTQHILDAQTKQRTIREVAEQGDMIMDKVYRAIYNAEFVGTPTGGSSEPVLKLGYADPSKSPTAIYMSGGIIIIEEGSSGPIPLHNERIQGNIQFTDVTHNDSWSTIDIQLTLGYNSSSNRYQYQYKEQWHGTAVIRNYVR